MAIDVGASITLFFNEAGIDLVPANGPEAHIPYRGLSVMETSGRGQLTSGGGFIGGGFGLEGAAEGMAIATVLNSLTTMTTMETVLHMQGAGVDLFIHHGDRTPAQLRIDLSPAIGRLSDGSSSSGDGDLVEQLSKLGDLRDAGLLDDQEFKLVKQKLLGGK